MIEDFSALRQQMRVVAEMARLPLRSGFWSGINGSINGQGTGSSLDFQDQRPYVPGDDPRHINWQAYARNGSYTMKLYRQEVSPRVDLVVDVSPSMFISPAKTKRVWELAYFAVESALQLGASLKVHAVGKASHEVPLAQVMGGKWGLEEQTGTPEGPRLELTPLRPGALRVLISDLLYPAAPERVTLPLISQRGRGILLAPFCKDEAEPDWQGNIDFEDAETLRRDRRRVPEATRERYLQAYRRHFDLWREPCLRQGIAFARVASEPEFIKALRAEAAASGAVEMT
ncbi:MAG: hypothetical protein JWO08_4338 [Verrucomicrobiaceae bacterium]|nr:hypothetical protein [Verrucomicrobiaceae bacterium]